MSSSLKEKSDNIIAFAFLKRLMMNFSDTESFKLGLINSSGKVIRHPQSQKEIENFTVLDQLAIKIRRMLGTKINDLNNFLYVANLPNNYVNNLKLNNSNSGKAEIKRIKKSLQLSESETLLNEMPHVHLDADNYRDFYAEKNPKWVLDFAKYYRSKNYEKRSEINKHNSTNNFFKIIFKSSINNLNEEEKKFVHLVLPSSYFK